MFCLVSGCSFLGAWYFARLLLDFDPLFLPVIFNPFFKCSFRPGSEACSNYLLTYFKQNVATDNQSSPSVKSDISSVCLITSDRVWIADLNNSFSFSP